MSQLYNELSGIFRTSSTDPQRSNSTAQVATDLRKLLEKKYRSDANIPTELTDALFPNRGSFSESVMSDIHDGNDEVERTIIAKVLDDPNIPAAEKEVIAKSILQGNFEIQRASHSSQQKSRHQQRLQTTRQVATHGKDYNQRQNILMHINRHRLPKPHFLEVITHAADIPIVSPKKLHRERVQILKNSISLGKLKPKSDFNRSRSGSPKDNEGGFSDDPINSNPFLTATNSTVEGESRPRQSQSTKSATIFRDPNPTYRERYSKLLAEERVKRLKEAKEKVLADREHIKRQKEYEKLSIEKRVEVKKRLNEFRQKLKEFLQQKKDPMSGEIMRVMDDSLVYYLLEKYAGYSMSPEAILALLGSSIGAPILNPDPEDMPTLAKKPPELSSEVLGGGALGLSQSVNDSEYFLPESSLMKKSTMTASLSAQLSYASMINNYKAFGQRSPTNSPPHSPSPPPSRPSLYDSSHDNIFDRTFPASMVFSHGIKADSNSPVTGFPLRPLEYDLHPGGSAPFKAYAGGFRARTNPHSSSSGVGREEPDAHPLFNNATSPYPGNSGRKSPLVVLSSEHFRSVAREMGYSFPNLLQENLEDPLGDRLAAEQAERDFDATQEKIEDAISVMHEQLLEEGMLPALRPNAVMTRQQLEALGEKKLTVDELFYQLTGKDLRKVLKRAPTSRAEEIKAKLERNPTMTASSLSMINDLLELEREQELQSRVNDEGKDKSGVVIETPSDRPPLSSESSFPGSFPMTPSTEPLPPPQRDDVSTGGGSGEHYPLLSQGTSHKLQPIPEAKSKSTDSQDDYLTGRGDSRKLSVNVSFEGQSGGVNSESPHKSALKRSHTSPGRISRMNSYSGGELSEEGIQKTTPNSRPLLLRGATMMIPEQAKQHLEEISKQEGAKAVKRLVLPAARHSKEKYQELLAEFPLLQQSVEKEEKEALDRIIAAGNQKKDTGIVSNETKEKESDATLASQKTSKKRKKRKDDKPKDLDSLFEKYPQFDDPIPQKGPRSLKSRELNNGGSFLQRSGSQPRPSSSSSSLEAPSLQAGGSSQLPPNPYQSWAEETKVLNSGVASGAGLMLWQSRDRANSLGRYRVGRNTMKSPALRPLPRELHLKSTTADLGGSIGNPYNVNTVGYNGIHSDNIYAKSKYRLKPFVSAI